MAYPKLETKEDTSLYYVKLNPGSPNRQARRTRYDALVICECGVPFKAQQSTVKCKMCRRRERRQG